jgi:hypothetical protein
MRRVVLCLQNALHQVVENMNQFDVDSSLFEHNIKVENDDDLWYGLQLPYFWNTLLPKLKRLWEFKMRRAQAANQDADQVDSFPYTEKELLWAFSNFNDAYGVVMKRKKVMFRRCSCEDENGNRLPCVPPKVGYMCYRECYMFKVL